MKLSQVALVTAAMAMCCVGVRAFQRTADFGFGNDESPSNVKAEFYWSRLAYSANIASLEELRRLWALGFQRLVARLSEGRPPVSHRDAPADPHRRPAH